VPTRVMSEMIIIRRGVKRSASTPPNNTSRASGAVQAASAKPTPAGPYPAASTPIVTAIGIMLSPSSDTVRRVK